MKKTHYIFGYLFVRFSKLLAILTALATTITVIYLWIDYGLKADNLAYHKTSALDLQCRQLEDELEFAKNEVSRIGSVGDLAAINLPSGSDDSGEFAALLGALKSASHRQSVLKERLTDGFTTRTELLRSKIRSVVESIEASRAAARPEPQVKSDASPPPARVSQRPTGVDQQKTVFDSMNSGRLDNLLGTMRQVGDFLDQLAFKAEKEENKKLIQDAKAALNDITAWLPRKQLETGAGSSIGTPLPSSTSAGASTPKDDSPPPDPLTTARNNYQNLGNAIDIVRTEICRDWRIDRILLETTQMAETEAQKCRYAEASLKMQRLASAGKVGRYLLAGLVVAFLILVFADFLQSFFDTASNSAAILEFLERKQ